MITLRQGTKLSPAIWLVVVNLTLFGMDRLGRLHLLRAPLDKVSLPIQGTFSRLGLAVTSELSRPFKFRAFSQKYEAIQDQFDLVLAENAHLRSRINELEELGKTKGVISDSSRVILAGVVESGDRLVIDKGSREGVKEGAAVVVGSVLVGRVSSVTPHLSVVSLTTDPSVKLPALIVPRSGDLDVNRIRGLAVGRFNQEVELTQVLTDELLETGQFVLTAGGTGMPANFVIGEVTEVKKQEAEIFYSARVRPLVDFKKIGTVAIIIGGDLE